MDYRYLGRSGLKLSALSFGSWVTFGKQVGDDVASKCMTAAYDAGVNFFDNAEVYADGRSESVMGDILHERGWSRDSYVVSTKIFWGGAGPNQRGLSRKHIVEGTHASLRRLRLDYVDLLFCHRPDEHTPLEETVRAMSHLVDQGKVLYWGTSEWSAQQIMEAHAVARLHHLTPPLMEQPQYHMFHRDRFEGEYRRLYDAVGLGTTIWSPLAGGLLTGKYDKGIPAGTRATLEGLEWLRKRYEGSSADDIVAKVRTLAQEVARPLGCTTAQLALAWCLNNPHVSTVITGASKVEQLQENLKALEVAPKLTPEVMARIERILDNQPEPETDHRG